MEDEIFLLYYPWSLLLVQSTVATTVGASDASLHHLTKGRLIMRRKLPSGREARRSRNVPRASGQQSSPPASPRTTPRPRRRPPSRSPGVCVRPWLRQRGGDLRW